MNNQITLLALAAEEGLPLGGDHGREESARLMPSLCNIEPRARPVKPMPISERKALR
jgi:hypothetical protein